MNTVFESVLSASLSGGIIIALILILRLVLKKAPRRYICLLWLLAAVRLLVPLEIESSLSLQPDVGPLLAQRQEESIAQEPADPVPAVPGGTENGSMSVAGSSAAISDDVVISTGDALSGGDVTVSVSDWTEAVPGIWTAVACGFLVYTLISYIVLKWKVRGAVWLDGNVYECAAISSPFLLGYLRPRIYLPVGLAPGDMEHILAHERAHIRRLDHWTKLVLFLCLAVHWFNPLVWAAYILLCRDMEMACDEAVIRDMPLERRKDYSRALVNCAANMRLVSACPVAFGEVSVKARILKVLNYRRPVFWISLICIVAIVFVAVCFLTSPAEPEPVVGMEWLQSLEPEDVASVRFSVAANPLSYTDYSPEEIPEILEFLQSCDGILIENNNHPPADDGERKHFYVTMNDGTVHTLTSWGTYVLIEGRSYRDCTEWLAQWPVEGLVQVDTVERMLNALERERIREGFYLSSSCEEQRNQIWMRDSGNWYHYTDDNGSCEEYLFYDGQHYHNEYRYVGPDYVTEGGQWQAEDVGASFELPWPMNEKQDPADYEYVETTYNKYEVPTVTLRYLPDGTLLHLLVQEAGGWVSSYDVESSDGTTVHYGVWNPSSSGTAYSLLNHYWEATGQMREQLVNNDYTFTREELDAQKERCRRALEEFQAADSYSLMQTDLGYDPHAEESTLLVWNSGDNWVRQYSAEVSTDTYLQYDGHQYQKYASTTMTKPWAEADLSGETDCRDSWLRQYQWDAEKTYCDYYSDDLENEGYTRIDLFVLDDAMYGGYYYMHFTLDDQGRICNVSRRWIVGNGNPSRSSYIHVYYHDGDAVATYIADAYREAVGE